MIDVRVAIPTPDGGSHMSRPNQRALLVDETYARIRDHVLPTRDELRWRAIPWRASLRDAVVDARALDKPILLWAMDGHPLGSTCSNGISDRLFVWSDPAIQALAAQFVPAADDAGALHRGHGDGADSELFRTIAEQGHFAGRVVPTDSRQGIYAATPAGRLLASINTTDPRRLEPVLETALARWRALSPDERRAAVELPDATARASRAGAMAGRVLRVHSRDLPRDGAWGGAASIRVGNQDHVWLSVGDVRSFLPVAPRTRRRVSQSLVDRVARFHLVDNVRGQSLAFAPDATLQAELWSEVTADDGRSVTLRLEGHARAVERGAWPVRGGVDVHEPAPQERGYDLTLAGDAVIDVEKGRFNRFELLAAGTRWGGTQYNRREDDLDPAPFGVVLVLAADGTAVRAALDPTPR
jgi:hypothetical protein